jgi:Fur family transcriptional regulator, ferric uptake regulator
MSDIPIQRMTHQRRVILEELGKVKTHPTADEIYQMVRRHLPHISLGTVYRNLDVLSRSGVVLKLATSGAQARFDATTGTHYHIQCTDCGRMDDLEALPEGFMFKHPPALPCEAGGYELSQFRVDFVGVCPNCRKQKESRE